MQVEAVRLSGIRKAFGANEVLRGIDIELPGGQVTALMGANGAGKSTLVKILSGVHRADAGQIELDGQPCHPTSPRDALHAGIVTVHQQIDDGVVPDLDIACNLMLDRLAAGHDGIRYRRRAVHAQARAVASALALDFDLSRPVRELGLAERQLVAIARAMAHEPRLLILDEPTSSLSATEAERLFTLIDRLVERGVAILYISHRLSDLRRVAQRVVCLRDGQITGLYESLPLDLDAAAQAMLGHQLAEHDFDVQTGTDCVLSLQNVCLQHDTAPINLRLNTQEVVAVTGLVGAGKTALASMLFGLRPAASGQCLLDGESYGPRTPREAIDRGVYLCPKDRSVQAVVQGLDLAANISLPFTSDVSRAAFISGRRERRVAQSAIETLGIICQHARDTMASLSGGNQQKAMVARWLWQRARVLLLDEPFQGVDIGARRDIARHLRQTAGNRATLVLVSELDEALEVADRVLVMAEGTIVGEHQRGGIDYDQLLQQVTGSTPPASLSTA